MTDNEVFHHFPPIPTEEPGAQRRVALHPPKSQPLTVDTLARATPLQRLELILDCNDDHRLFGINSRDERFTLYDLVSTRKRLLFVAHPDKHTAVDQPKATRAYQKVETVFNRLKLEFGTQRR